MDGALIFVVIDAWEKQILRSAYPTDCVCGAPSALRSG
jgi:hypothetical protein